MPETQAVITLHPLFRPDVLPFRSLTIASDSDSINIGRASKRETKNLAPAHHNAWFESRVMSRNHASLTASLEKKDIYIRDNGSMHGTLLNDKRITANSDVKLSTGDVLTFGAEVVRASETFQPLRVRCECQWFDTRQEKALGSPFPHAPNSFCVPDDDDDIIEIAYDSMPAKPVYNVDDSDIDSDNHHPAEHSTPLTSPSSHEKELVESKHEEKVEADKGSHDTPEDPQGSQKSPIVLDSEQLAVEPALSELINDCDSNNDDAEYDLYESENDIGSDSDNNGIELDSCDEDEQPAGDEDDSSSDQMSTHDSDRDDASMELSHVPITANYKPPYVEAEDDMEDGDIPSCVSEAGSIFDSRRKELLEHMVRFELNHEEQLAESRRKLRDHSPLKINDTRVPKHSTPPALPMLNERPGDLLVNYHKHGDRSAPSTAFYPPEYGISYLPVYENSYMPYQDGPFMMDQPNMQNNGSCAADFAEVASLNNHPKNPLDDQAQQSEKCAPDHHPSEKDLVDFFDWVEEKGSQKESLKRKADEMDKESPSDIPATSKSLPESVDDIDIDQPAVGSSEWLFFQDAQPKVPDGALKCSPSQLSDLQPIKDPQPTQDAPLSSHKDQPPRKRAKTGKKSRVEKKSRKGSIASYATTALVGAMVGGLGTIAALASLPPEYFQ